MKVLQQAVPGNSAMGRCWLDPRDLPLLLENTLSRVTSGGDGVAGLVLAGRHLVASTISCDDHCSMADRAGLELKERSPFYDDDDVADLRGFATRSTITIEVWRPDDEKHPDYGLDGDDDVPAVETKRLDGIIAAAKAHPALRSAFPKGLPEVSVSIMCSLGRAEWTYSEIGRELHPAGRSMDVTPPFQP